MTKVPVKKYRVRRARKWIKRTVVPLSIRARAVAAQWARPDHEPFPLNSRAETTGLDRYEYSWLSQNGEDGVLRYIFNEIGFESRWLVEFGFGAKQCNGLRLIVKEEFSGLFMDGSQEEVDIFNYAAKKHSIDKRVTAVRAFVTRGNLQDLVTSHGVPCNIDLLSVDVDGNDYWFWEGLECISPRVVCIEYNAGLGPHLSVTVPYDDAFERFGKHPSGFFYGASLAALAALGKRKGYYLVGCDSTGTNAFFLRNDIMINGLAEFTVPKAFRPHANWLGRGISEARQLEIMEVMPYEDV